MSEQLASLEASLTASDAQAGSLRQELASFGNGPPTFKVNGTEMNGSASANLPKGYYYTLADLSPAGPAAQESTAQQQPQSAEPAEGSDATPEVAASQSEDNVVVPEEQHNTASTADASTPGPENSEQEKRPYGMAASQPEEGSAITADVHSAASEDANTTGSNRSRDQDKGPGAALLGDAREASGQSSTTSTEQQAAQPGIVVAHCSFAFMCSGHHYHASTEICAHVQLLKSYEGTVKLFCLYLSVIIHKASGYMLPNNHCLKAIACTSGECSLPCDMKVNRAAKDSVCRLRTRRQDTCFQTVTI